MADKIEKVVVPSLPLEPAGEQHHGDRGRRERHPAAPPKQERPPATSEAEDVKDEKDKDKGTVINIRV
jgi:hypothetical protein